MFVHMEPSYELDAIMESQCVEMCDAHLEMEPDECGGKYEPEPQLELPPDNPEGEVVVSLTLQDHDSLRHASVMSNIKALTTSPFSPLRCSFFVIDKPESLGLKV